MSSDRDATKTIIAAPPMDGKDSEGDYRPSHVARAEAHYACRSRQAPEDRFPLGTDLVYRVIHDAEIGKRRRIPRSLRGILFIGLDPLQAERDPSALADLGIMK